MYASRSAVRASRALRAPKQQQLSVMAGITSPAQQYMKETQEQFKKQFAEKAPEPNEALKWLRQVSTYYAGFLPGASGFVNTTFDDLDRIRDKHGDEVDKIVSEAYNELKGIAQKGGADLKTAQQAWDVLQKHISRIAELAGDAAEDIINNHPKLKEAVGGNLDKIKQYGDSYGPEAKKVYEDTKSQIQDIIKSGVSADSAQKLQKLVKEKLEQLKKMGDEAWKKGIEQAKPYLDKNPKVKELIENNADALKQGNAGELFEKAKQAVNEGSTEDLEKYVEQAKKKAEKSLGGLGGNIEQYLNKLPGGGEIFQKLQHLQEVAKQKGPEAQKLLEQTIKEVGDVLNKKSDEAKKIADDAKKES